MHGSGERSFPGAGGSGFDVMAQAGAARASRRCCREIAAASELGFALTTARDTGREGETLPLVVALHARGSDAVSGIARARRLFGAGPDVVSLQAARPCNPFQSNCLSVASYAGFSWMLGEDPERPEAASFGDACAQVELFVRGVARPFVLAGEGQGASIAATVALTAPGALRGLHLSRAGMPQIEGWELPELRMSGVEVVFDRVCPFSKERSAALLAARGATLRDVADAQALPEWLRSLARTDPAS